MAIMTTFLYFHHNLLWCIISKQLLSPLLLSEWTPTAKGGTQGGS